MDRRKRKTIEAIEKAMLELLANKPLDKILMTEIAKEADINRSTLYSYFDNPQKIFASIAEKSIQKLNEKLGHTKYSMESFIKIYMQYMRENYPIFLEIHRSSVSNEYIKEIEQLMNEHLEGRKLQKDSVMSRYCNYGFFGISAEWLISGCKVEIEEIIGEMMPIMRIFEAI